MSRVFVTGSSSGLGLMTARLLISEGHEVVLHGRDRLRAQEALADAPGAVAAVAGDVSCISEMRAVAEQVNRLGRFDAVIHNVGVGYREPRRIETEDHLCHVFAINVLAPYVLTALICRPSRLVYLSSAVHTTTCPNFNDLMWNERQWNGERAYAESKLYDTLLAFAIARRWPNVCANAVHPGWVPTRMGGPDATDDIDRAHFTQAWLAVSHDSAALTSGQYFYHRAIDNPNPIARDELTQWKLLDVCSRLTNVEILADSASRTARA